MKPPQRGAQRRRSPGPGQAGSGLHASILALGLLLAPACRTDVEAGIVTANDLFYQGDHVAAERLYRKLLVRLSDSEVLTEAESTQRIFLLTRLSKLEIFYLRDYGQAIADLEATIRLAPRSDAALAALFNLADLYRERLDSLPQAVETYQRLLSDFGERPEVARAHLALMRCYSLQKNYTLARNIGETVLARWPTGSETTEARFQLAEILVQQQQYSAAVPIYERLLSDHPAGATRALGLFELGGCYQDMDEPARALQYYYSALAQHPNPGLVQRKIQRVRARLHDTTPAGNILNANAKVGGRGAPHAQARPRPPPAAANSATADDSLDASAPTSPATPAVAKP